MTQNTYNNDAQIIRKDGKDVIFEVLSTGFGIEKAVINIQKYNKEAQAGSKVIGKVQIYVDFATFLRLVNDFARTNAGYDRLEKEGAEAAKQNKKYYGFALVSGGTPATRLAQQNRSRPDGKDEARSLIITKSSKEGSILLTGLSGPGKTSPTGGIIMDGAPDTRVSIALTIDDWKEVLLSVEAHINGCITYKIAKQMREREANYKASQNNQSQKATQPKQAVKSQEPVSEVYHDFDAGVSSFDPFATAY